jgi:hypothetical protein
MISNPKQSQSEDHRDKKRPPGIKRKNSTVNAVFTAASFVWL